MLATFYFVIVPKICFGCRIRTHTDSGGILPGRWKQVLRKPVLKMLHSCLSIMIAAFIQSQCWKLAPVD